ncbi:MAG: hypothetical protein JSS94_05130 [Bacteroidetes bacterium]|nr:hypothetical protein [Bacteroidota bacterium]
MKLSNSDLLILYSTIVILLVTSMMFFIYTYFLKQKSIFILKQKEKDLEFQEVLALSQIEIREQTLSYIGQELHDDLGQKLSVAKLLINQINAIENQQCKDKIDEVNLILGESIKGIRSLSKTYITEQVEHFGFIDSLQREINRINKLNLIEVEFNFNNHDIDIHSKHSLILFRITQECITNILKHSKAQKMQIKVIDQYGHLKIIILDNGKGMEVEKAYHGSGIRSMKNRIKMINGYFNLVSEKDKGTATHITYIKQKN